MTPFLLSRRAILAGLSSLCGLRAAACSAPTDHVIAITRMKFGPAPEPLVVGDVIVWHNQDLFRHTATARDGSFDLDLPPGKEAQVTLMTAGEIEVFCRFHPGMKLKLKVSPA